MCTTNEELANLVAAVQSAGLVSCVRFEQRRGTAVMRVDGLLGQILAVLGPGHVSEREGDVVWFRRTSELRRVLTAAIEGLERRIREESAGR